ncbi:hypothetical protein H4R35_002595 [Dimargaris xerosporica]|nr:hypothetical protein H4R35_002595 [Dimargaris xerosporica]
MVAFTVLLVVVGVIYTTVDATPLPSSGKINDCWKELPDKRATELMKKAHSLDPKLLKAFLNMDAYYRNRVKSYFFGRIFTSKEYQCLKFTYQRMGSQKLRGALTKDHELRAWIKKSFKNMVYNVTNAVAARTQSDISKLNEFESSNPRHQNDNQSGRGNILAFTSDKGSGEGHQLDDEENSYYGYVLSSDYFNPPPVSSPKRPGMYPHPGMTPKCCKS